MSDYIADLISQGMSEEEAFEKAKAKLATSKDLSLQSDLQAKIQHYYESQSPAHFEAIGLFYGGSVILGLTVGALVGYLTGDGWQTFLRTGWIDVAIGAGVGCLIGVGVGLFCHGVMAVLSRSR